MPSRRQNSSNNVSVVGVGAGSHRSKESTSYVSGTTAHGHGVNGSSAGGSASVNGASNHQGQIIQALVQRLWAKVCIVFVLDTIY